MNCIVSTVGRGSVCVQVGVSASKDDVWDALYRRLPAGMLDQCTLQGEFTAGDTYCILRLVPKMCGGKGGFSSQLRASAGKMTSRRKRGDGEQPNRASCRDLEGRRLGVVEQAKGLEEYIRNAPAAEREAMMRKKEALEKVVQGPSVADVRVRMDLGAYDEQGDEIKDNVRSAVSGALKKQQQKEQAAVVANGKKRAMAGWDDEEDSSDGEEQSSKKVVVVVVSKGKGKGKAAVLPKAVVV